MTAGDLVIAMLAAARQAVSRASFVRFDAARLPFADATFELAVSTFALHHMREQRRVAAEVQRVLKPGGRFHLVTWGVDDPACPAMDAWDELLVRMGGAVDDPDPNPSWHDDINTPEALGKMMTGAGFRPDSIVGRRGERRCSAGSLAGLRRGIGAGRRRRLTIPEERRAEFDRRADTLLAGLPEADFVWRPELVVATLTKPAKNSPGESTDADYRTTCPNCGAPMYDRGCKTRCPRCHFFTDCSDPW